jgi:hypothetical protein
MRATRPSILLRHRCPTLLIRQCVMAIPAPDTRTLGESASGSSHPHYTLASTSTPALAAAAVAADCGPCAVCGRAPHGSRCGYMYVGRRTLVACRDLEDGMGRSRWGARARRSADVGRRRGKLAGGGGFGRGKGRVMRCWISKSGAVGRTGEWWADSAAGARSGACRAVLACAWMTGTAQCHLHHSDSRPFILRSDVHQ